MRVARCVLCSVLRDAYFDMRVARCVLSVTGSGAAAFLFEKKRNSNGQRRKCERCERASGASLVCDVSQRVQRSAFIVQRSAVSVQRSAVSVQRSAFSGQRSAFSSICSVQRLPNFQPPSNPSTRGPKCPTNCPCCLFV